MQHTPETEKLYALFLSSNGVTTDTRQITGGQIFFALKGDKFNGNLFATQALQAGAAWAVVDEIPQDCDAALRERLIVCENVLATLQDLASCHRAQFRFPVLAITGSNGKTTTKELVAAVLSRNFKTAFTKGNLNNHIGIPLTLLSINKDTTEFAVIEMGANHQGEIAAYCKYVRPDFGLITNVGLAHIEGFGGFEGVVKGKTELYRDLMERHGKIFINADNAILLQNTIGYEGQITYGTSNQAQCRGEISGAGEFLKITSGELKIATNLVGDYNFENVLSAVCVGRYFGVPDSDIKIAIETYVPSNNRSQKIVRDGCSIILDAYNANPSSMAEALRNFEKLESKKKITILGEMMELGPYSTAEHERINKQVRQMALTQRVFVGNGFSFLKDQPDTLWFRSTTEARTWWAAQDLTDALILIKGSRANALEKILE